MTMLLDLASFITHARFEDLSEPAVEALKVHILDAVGCAIGALHGEPIGMLRHYLDQVGGREVVTLIGGGRTSPDRAALYNGALVRYLDFNDSYLAEGETCHPSDNLAPVLAAAELAGGSGRDLLVALALAYQVQCRLSDVAPVRAKGFDHTTQGSYAVAAGVARALGLERDQAANAVAIAGTAFNALRVTRTGALSHWKGLAYPNTAFAATHAVLLAREGITAPPEVFEGNKGFMDAIAGPFEIAWQEEDLERIRRCSVKKYNAEFHSQSTLEGILELREESHPDPEGSPGSTWRCSTSPSASSAAARRATSKMSRSRSRPITVCRTWWPRRCWTARWALPSTPPNASPARTSRRCCARSTYGRRRTCRRASQGRWRCASGSGSTTAPS